MGLGDTKICLYQFTFYKEDTYNTYILKYFVMKGLVICIKLNSYAAHMLYACPLSHNTSVPIVIKHNKYSLSLYTNTTVFDWGDINSI